MAGVLDCLLYVLGEAAGEVLADKTASGINKEREKILIGGLACIYEKHLGKPPSAGNGSIFRKFAAELSNIIGYKLGPDIIREVLSD